MLLKQLEYFVSVVEHNSFTQAAYENYVSQSAISQQIKSLEASLGVPLMVREKRSFHLTPAGEYLYRNGKHMMLRIKNLQEETARIGKNERKYLRIGYLNRYSGIALQQALMRTTKRYRDLDVRMYSGSHSKLNQMLDDNLVDIIFNDYWQMTNDYDFNSYAISTATVIAEVPKGYTTEGAVELKELLDLPLILVCDEDQRLDEENNYRKSLGFAGSFIHVKNLEEARFLVAAGQGILLVDRFKYLVDSIPGIERKCILSYGKPIERDYYFYVNAQNLNTYAEAFKDIFLQVLDEF